MGIIEIMVRLNRYALYGAFAALASIGSWPAMADEVGPRAPVVLELFTSQGCAFCPPADALLAELAQRDDVVALGLHVDYWNHLGWSDTYATAANSRRQRDYSILLGERMVYTPQIVIDGVVAVVGSRRASVLAAIDAALAVPHPVEVLLRREDDMLHIAATAPHEAADMVYFIYEPPSIVAVRHGENAGRALTYANAVRAWMPLERWSEGARSWSVPVPNGAQGVAAVVQAAADGRVMGAARLDLGAARADAAVEGAKPQKK